LQNTEFGRFCSWQLHWGGNNRWIEWVSMQEHIQLTFTTLLIRVHSENDSTVYFLIVLIT